MAKLSNYMGNVELVDGLIQKNNENFPLLEANAVLVGDNDKRLDTELEEIKRSIENAGGGQAGVGIEDITINANGEMVITLSNGDTKNLGVVVGSDGVGVQDVSIDNRGNLVVELSNGDTQNLGRVVGDDGDDGKTPYIQNGYWYINGVNTGVRAEGKDGTGVAIKANRESCYEVGDAYIDPANGHLMVLTALPDTFTDAGEIKGEEGKSAYDIWLENGGSGSQSDFLKSLKGDKGDQGDRGEKGDKGEQGEKGEKGDRGEQGIQGARGKKGDQGEQGIQGDKGVKGDKGDQGIQGVQGVQGIKGEQGIQGEKGEKGDTGARGERGIQGQKGEKGDSGVILATQGQPTFVVRDGHLYVYVPENSANPYRIDENGRLKMMIATIEGQ